MLNSNKIVNQHRMWPARPVSAHPPSQVVLLYLHENGGVKTRVKTVKIVKIGRENGLAVKTGCDRVSFFHERERYGHVFLIKRLSRQFREGVASGRLRLPCATAPAADAWTTSAERRQRQGRRGDPPTVAHRPPPVRPLALYRGEAMLVDTNQVLHLPSPELKEALHHIPVKFTATEINDARTRHRLLGNGWRCREWRAASSPSSCSLRRVAPTAGMPTLRLVRRPLTGSALSSVHYPWDRGPTRVAYR